MVEESQELSLKKFREMYDKCKSNHKEIFVIENEDGSRDLIVGRRAAKSGWDWWRNKEKTKRGICVLDIEKMRKTMASCYKEYKEREGTRLAVWCGGIVISLMIVVTIVGMWGRW